MKTAEATLKEQGIALSKRSDAHGEEFDTINGVLQILLAQIAEPTLNPDGGSLADGSIQGTDISVKFNVVQGDQSAPTCAEPAGVLKAAGQ